MIIIDYLIIIHIFGRIINQSSMRTPSILSIGIE